MAVKDRIAATLTKGEAIRAGVLDANQAAEVITSNSRKQYGFTRKMVPVGLPTEPKLYIYSVTEYGSHIVDGQSDGAGIVNLGPGFPMFEVFACPDGDDYSEQPCIIDPIHFFEEAKVDVTEHTFQSGQQMADAIMMIGPGMAASLNRTNIGWFISSSNPPKDAEIDRAKELFTAQCQRLLREADSYHARNMLNEINETHRRAAKWLKQTKKPWVSVEFKMIDCPGCMEAVREGIIYHAPPSGCGYIFDTNEYNKRYAQAKSQPAKQQQPAQ